MADQPAPDWDNPQARVIIEQILTAANDEVDAVFAANDGLAGAAITAMQAAGLDTQNIPISGQDATVPGIQLILSGDQTMTVYKPITQEVRPRSLRPSPAQLRGRHTVAPTPRRRWRPAVAGADRRDRRQHRRDRVRRRFVSEEDVCPVTSPSTASQRLTTPRGGAPREHPLWVRTKAGSWPKHHPRMPGVSKAFGAVQALYGVDFEVRPGEVMALVGDNGAGKSTLIKGIAGIYPFDRGQVRYEGDDVEISGPAEAAGLGIESSTRTWRWPTTWTSWPTCSWAASARPASSSTRRTWRRTRKPPWTASR